MPASDFGGPVATRVATIVQPILDDLGLLLYDCEHAGGTVTITVDKDGGVLLDELALVTRLVSRELDHDDPVPGRYTLEVSSPGLERRLRRPDHFARAIGSAVAVRLARPVEGLRRLDGAIVAAGDDRVTIRLDDPAATEMEISYTDIERAKTVFSWGPGPKPGKGPSKRAVASGPAAGETIDDNVSTTHPQEAAAS